MHYSVSKNGTTVTAAVKGELTFAVQRDFRAMLQEMTAAGGSKWVLDLRQLAFIDSAGLGLLLRARAVAEKSGAAAALRPPEGGQVADILDIAHFEQMFEFA